MARINARPRDLETRIQTYRREADAIRPRAPKDASNPSTDWRSCLPENWLAGDEGLQPLLQKSGQFTAEATQDPFLLGNPAHPDNKPMKALTDRRSQALEMDIRNRMLDQARQAGRQVENAIRDYGSSPSAVRSTRTADSSSSSMLEVVNDTVARMADDDTPGEDDVAQAQAKLTRLLSDFHAQYEELRDQQNSVEQRQGRLKTPLRANLEAAYGAVEAAYGAARPYAPLVTCALIMALSYMIGQRFDEWDLQQRRQAHTPEPFARMSLPELKELHTKLSTQYVKGVMAYPNEVKAKDPTGTFSLKELNQQYAQLNVAAFDEIKELDGRMTRLKAGLPPTDRTEPQLGTQRQEALMNSVGALIVAWALVNYVAPLLG